MFKIISIIAAFIVVMNLPVSGQSGNFLIGGKMGFSYSSDDNGMSESEDRMKSKTVSFSGAPVFGYFFTTNFMAGIDFDFTIEKITSKGYYEFSKTKTITLNPLVRFYFNSPFFAEARFIWGPGKSEINYDDTFFPVGDTKYSSRKLGFGAGIGYDIKLSEGLRLEPMIYYTRYSYEIKELELKNKRAQIMFNLGLIYLL